uniref:Dipeptidyl peptidase 2 n=1 Tax=Phallusia mammillata TaxID=59560 RepID=A0A6F9DAR4_9ASCI|nr:dipeptidyl peptidase 2 [Phallusia mammillata]
MRCSLFFLSCFALFIFVSSKSIIGQNGAMFEERYFTQFVDHFNMETFGTTTYQQRYLITEQYWTKGSGPIFFYTGNEGNIEGFQKASGLLVDLAAKMGAMVVFAEHRFYGTSLPFGNNTFMHKNIGLLTVEQAMADYAYLIEHLKESYNATHVPVIAFGGSYGGQLAAYMRMKYPNLIAGSLAASAPLYWITGHGDRHGFWKSVTEIFGKQGSACVDRIKEGFKDTNDFAAKGKFTEITAAFHTCEPVTSETLDHLYEWIRNSFTDLAMMNYPYPSDFLAPLPGHPVKAACEMITSAPTAIEGLAAGAGLFYNGTSSHETDKVSLQCFDIMKEYVECADPTGCGLGNDALAWNYQACTEIVLPGGTNNITDMFPVLPFTLEMRDNYCVKNVGVKPRNRWLSINFWSENLDKASNIIFSNGDLDPWRDGGILTDLSPTLKALTVVGGAHHFDLRGSHKDDPQSVIDVREKEGAIIMDWVNQHWSKIYLPDIHITL